jgi:hypothetical protein
VGEAPTPTDRHMPVVPVVVFISFNQLVLHKLIDRLQHNLVTQQGIQLCLSSTRLQLHPV